MSRETWIGVCSTVVAVLVAVFSVVGTPQESEQLSTLPQVVIAALVVGALTFALVVPWARRTKTAAHTNRPAKAGLVCSILGLVTVLAFWSGLPIILGAGGAVLGRVGQERARQTGQRGLALSALALGVVAAVFGVVLFLLGRFLAG